MNNYDYPIGADTDNAPWNKHYPEEREIEVTISVTLSKTISIKVDDYEIYEDNSEDGKRLVYDYSNCNLIKAVENQIVLPEDWNVDDFSVICEE